MTPEQLLQRRFKYVQPYPDSQYKLGEIITIAVEQTEDGIMQKVQRDPEGIGDTDLWYDATKFWDFDKNFRQLNWWEERKPEDLPQYVKMVEDNSVYRVKRYDGLLFFYETLLKPEDSEWLYKVIPATEEEEARAWNAHIPFWNQEIE